MLITNFLKFNKVLNVSARVCRVLKTGFGRKLWNLKTDFLVESIGLQCMSNTLKIFESGKCNQMYQSDEHGKQASL